MEHQWKFKDRTGEWERYQCERCVRRTLVTWAYELEWDGCKLRSTLSSTPPQAIRHRLTRLLYQEGTSDKEYQVWIERVPNRDGRPKYCMKYAYGRRGADLLVGTKIRRADWEKCEWELERVVEEKRGKGYEIDS